MSALARVTLSAPGFVMSGPRKARPVDDEHRRLQLRLAELGAERRDLVARLLRNTEDREQAEADLERIDRG